MIDQGLSCLAAEASCDQAGEHDRGKVVALDAHSHCVFDWSLKPTPRLNDGPGLTNTNRRVGMMEERVTVRADGTEIPHGVDHVPNPMFGQGVKMVDMDVTFHVGAIDFTHLQATDLATGAVVGNAG
jgi:hypothetical protein